MCLSRPPKVLRLTGTGKTAKPRDGLWVSPLGFDPLFERRPVDRLVTGDHHGLVERGVVVPRDASSQAVHPPFG